MDSTTIGARLHTLRNWRGLTQEQLGDMAGFSPSQISLWETGKRMLDRRSQIAALASALRVSETDLAGGPHLGPDRVQSDPHMGIPPLRVALMTNTLTTPAADRAAPLAQLYDDVFSVIEPLRRTCDYVRAGRLLAPVIDGLYLHIAQPGDESASRRALTALVEACVIASAITKELGYADLAYLAAQRAEEAAVMLDDPVSKGKADFMWCLSLPRAGSWERTLTAAERAAHALEPHARDPLGKQVLGMLALTTALSAASLQRGDTAEHWLAEATAIGTQVADQPTGNWQAFSTTNVNMWRTAIAVERGESGSVMLDLAAGVNLDLVEKKASRRAGFLSEVGRGLAREPKTRGQAIRYLRWAEDAAPARTRNSAVIRETVTYLLHTATQAAVGRELRGMAARMGVLH